MTRKTQQLRGITNDEFARIANSRLKQTTNHRAPRPLPFRRLPSVRNNPAAAFARSGKIESDEQLAAELRRLRKQYAPYFRTLAPRLNSPRRTIRIETFQWREATPRDFADPAGVFSGDGEWRKITVPHYGPPLGRKTTFYRGTIDLDQDMIDAEALFIRFNGVDYRAHVFLNGHFLGSHEGFFAPFEFDCSACRRKGANVLVVRVENDAVCMGNGSWGFPQHQGDKIYAATGPGYDDPELGWHHCPPGMGIWQDVVIESRARVHVNDLFVRPLPGLSRVEAWIEIHNGSSLPADISFELSLHGENFHRRIFHRRPHRIDGPIGSGPNDVRFSIDIPAARRWTPASPWLYRLDVTVLDDQGRRLDAMSRCFGMRSFEMETHRVPKGRLLLNGQSVRLRGANTMGHLQQCVMRKDFSRLREDLLLFKAAHLNYVRLTQSPVQSEVYDCCDRVGLMTQTDLPLFAFLRRNQFCEAIRQAQEMERLVRGHPCNVINSLMNEANPTTPASSWRHLDRPELESFFDAAARAIRLSNPDRVVKPLDGDYDPPGPGLPDHHCYTTWYNGHGLDLGQLHKGFWMDVKEGWLHGCGEFGAEGLDPATTMLGRYPKQWLPVQIDDEWSPMIIPMAQTGRMHGYWFEAQRTLRDWVNASQQHQAWAVKWIAEALRRDPRLVSCAVHLLIDAWPAGWMKALVDVDRRAKPAYFTFRDAMKPLSLQWRSDRMTCFADEKVPFEAWTCHDGARKYPELHLHYQMEHDGRVVFAQQTRMRVPCDTSECAGVFMLDAPNVKTPSVIAVRAALIDSHGAILADALANIKVFPRAADPPQRRAVIVGDAHGPAARLARELGLHIQRRTTPLSGNVAVMIDDIRTYLSQRHAIDHAIKSGAVATILTMEPGQHQIHGRQVTVSEYASHAPFFVSRDTLHATVRSFAANDFQLWYDSTLDRIAPMAMRYFMADGFQPLLCSIAPPSNGVAAKVAVSSECRIGDGCLRLNTLHLNDRTVCNPVAHLFAMKLLGIDQPCNRQQVAG